MTSDARSPAPFSTDGAAHEQRDCQLIVLQLDEHVVLMRKLVRERALELRLSLIDQTKLITAASELARNTLKYGGGGEAEISTLVNGLQMGLCLRFSDRGPGISNVALALQDGYTTGGGLGLGLGGSKRLVDDFEIITAPGAGTTITICKWKR